MRLDEDMKDRFVIGYDLRIDPASLGRGGVLSFDPQIWSSVRQLAPVLFCDVYGVGSVWDVSNGVNLAVLPPTRIPYGYVLVAFDAPGAIVEYMCDAFGMQESLGAVSKEILASEYGLIGYDVVDLWTQSSRLTEFDGVPVPASLRNEYGLISSEAVAMGLCDKADVLFPDGCPHQCVGVWIDRVEKRGLLHESSILPPTASSPARQDSGCRAAR